MEGDRTYNSEIKQKNGDSQMYSRQLVLLKGAIQHLLNYKTVDYLLAPVWVLQ